MTVVSIPNIGTEEEVEIIEILVAKGDKVDKEQALLVLESDKASMEVPSPTTGEITDLKVKVGDKVKEGVKIAEIKEDGGKTDDNITSKVISDKLAEQKIAIKDKENTLVSKEPKKIAPAPETNILKGETLSTAIDNYYAGPAVRKMARELGVDLNQVTASGANGRILKEDIQQYIKQRLQNGGGENLLPMDTEMQVDFAAFGKIETQPMDKIKLLTAKSMRRSWFSVPHVTQFEEADVTDMENFRKMQKDLAQQKNIKLTPIPFLLKALALSLQEFPQFNVSLRGDSIVQKYYYHIGVAVDTPAGLVVPVIRDVDKKNIWELAAEIIDLADKARSRRIKPVDMQGGCITLSSLGAIGGVQFTPIINLPEVAILGVSRVRKLPVYRGDQLVPRLIMPLALSYDHRAVNGVDGTKFTTHIADLLSDIRKLAM